MRGNHTSLACSRVNLRIVRGAGHGATAGTGAGAVASGSVRMVTCELSIAELSNTEGVAGEAERCRTVPEVLVVHDEEGGDCTRYVSARTVRHATQSLSKCVPLVDRPVHPLSHPQDRPSSQPAHYPALPTPTGEY